VVEQEQRSVTRRRSSRDDASASSSPVAATAIAISISMWKAPVIAVGFLEYQIFTMCHQMIMYVNACIANENKEKEAAI
jgi:hypothetical protein